LCGVGDRGPGRGDIKDAHRPAGSTVQVQQPAQLLYKPPYRVCTWLNTPYNQPNVNITNNEHRDQQQTPSCTTTRETNNTVTPALFCNLDRENVVDNTVKSMNEPSPSAPAVASWSFRPTSALHHQQQQFTRAHSEDPPSTPGRPDAVKASRSMGPLPLGSPIRGVCSSSSPLRASCPGVGAAAVCSNINNINNSVNAAAATPSACLSAAAAEGASPSYHPARAAGTSDVTPSDQNPRPRPLPAPMGSSPSGIHHHQHATGPSPSAASSAHASHAPRHAHSSLTPGMRSSSGTSGCPIDVLLAPLLPGADEPKVLERLSVLRTALEAQLAVANHWEHQVCGCLLTSVAVCMVEASLCLEWDVLWL